MCQQAPSADDSLRMFYNEDQGYTLCIIKDQDQSVTVKVIEASKKHNLNVLKIMMCLVKKKCL